MSAMAKRHLTAARSFPPEKCDFQTEGLGETSAPWGSLLIGDIYL